MAHSKAQHPNAALTPIARRKMVACVLEQGWPVAAVAERFQVDPKTVRVRCCFWPPPGHATSPAKRSR